MIFLNYIIFLNSIQLFFYFTYFFHLIKLYFYNILYIPRFPLYSYAIIHKKDLEALISQSSRSSFMLGHFHAFA